MRGVGGIGKDERQEEERGECGQATGRYRFMHDQFNYVFDFVLYHHFSWEVYWNASQV